MHVKLIHQKDAKNKKSEPADFNEIFWSNLKKGFQIFQVKKSYYAPPLYN
jgi:hypothetical protein